MGNKHKNQRDPIEKLREWQDNQYNLGYYTGGKIPPYVSIPSKTSLFGRIYKIGARMVGMIYILLGVALVTITAFGAAISLMNDHGAGNISAALVVIILMGGLGILGILYGMRYLRNTKSRAKLHK